VVVDAWEDDVREAVYDLEVLAMEWRNVSKLAREGDFLAALKRDPPMVGESPEPSEE